MCLFRHILMWFMDLKTSNMKVWTLTRESNPFYIYYNYYSIRTSAILFNASYWPCVLCFFFAFPVLYCMDWIFSAHFKVKYYSSYSYRHRTMPLPCPRLCLRGLRAIPPASALPALTVLAPRLCGGGPRALSAAAVFRTRPSWRGLQRSMGVWFKWPLKKVSEVLSKCPGW